MPQNMNWIKITCSTVLILSFISTISGQEDKEGRNQRFSMSTKIGFDLSQMRGDGLSGFYKPGANLGAIVTGKLKDNHALSIGIEYINKGSRAPLDTVNHNTFAYRLNYIQIPLMYHFQYNKRLQFQFGPYAAYLIHQSVMANKVVYTLSEYGGQPGFRSWEVGGNVGATFIFNDQNNFLIEFGKSIIPIRPNPSKTNKYSFYESGNYNYTLSFCWIHQF